MVFWFLAGAAIGGLAGFTLGAWTRPPYYWYPYYNPYYVPVYYPAPVFSPYYPAYPQYIRPYGFYPYYMW